jgi:uncharacterized protein YjbI with pentapeptide repeats
VKIFAPLQIAQNQRTFEQNRQFHWVVSPSLFVRISTGKVELQHDCIADIMESMGDIPMLDMGMPKPKGEWLANACLFAPEGTEIQAGQASIEIAGNKKNLNVFGDRHWRAGIPSTPQKFTSMPLDFNRAYGSEEYAMNPVGLGFKTEKLPNIELAEKTITDNNSQYAPASFSPLDPSWPQRNQYQGTYDSQYMEKYFPGYPQDMDWRLFMNASQDQWLDNFFQGNEAFELSNLHPQKSLIKGQLPGLSPRCFIKDTSELAESQFKEVDLHLDTVWFFPDKDIIQLIWRGGMQVSSDEAEQISHVLLAFEDNQDPLRNSEHYRNAMNERIQNKDPLQDSLNTQDLIPLGAPSAMQLLQQSAMEDIQESPLSSNMQSKAETIQAVVDEKVERSLQELKQQIDNPAIDAQQKNDLLAKLDSLNSPKQQDPATEVLLKKLNKIIPGINSGNPKDLDLSEFSFKKLDEIFAEINGFSNAKKAEALESIKPQLDGLYQQLENADSQNNLDDQQRTTIKEQIQRLENLANDEVSPSLTALPRLDIEAIRQQINATSPDIQKAQQELHLMLTNPMLANNEKILKARQQLDNLQKNELAKISDNLDVAQNQFKQGYGMAAHFADHGLSPHKDDELQRNKLLSIANGNKDASEQDWACLDLSGQNLDDMNFSNCYMEQVNLSGASLVGANFSGAILARANLTNTNCSQANFDNANIGNSHCHDTIFDGSSFNESKFSKTEFIGTSFIGAYINQPEVLYIILKDCNFDRSIIKGFPFLELDLKNISFRNAQLETCNFINSQLTGCNLDSAFLPSTAWANTSISSTSFIAADMTSNCFVGADEDTVCNFENLNFSGAILNKANFQNLNLPGTLFTESELNSANFSGTDLSDSNFDDACGKQIVLRKANLNQASMKRADFMEGIMSKALLTNANLETCNLYGVDFIRATIKGTRFKGANLDATILRDWRPS